MIDRLKLTLLFFVLGVASHAQDKAILEGTIVVKGEGERIEEVLLLLNSGSIKQAKTNANGVFSIEVPANESFELKFIGSLCLVKEKLRLKSNEVRRLTITCDGTQAQLQEVKNDQEELPNSIMPTVEILNSNKGVESDLSQVKLNRVGEVVAGTNRIETVLTTLPGVNSNNELSSQFSVRGGSFDENLIYVNGVEMYRPFLIRSGKQEGLSFINPTMVQDISFSAGGFTARYGDKLSSVLEVEYRKPTENKAYLQASFLGAGATVDLVSKDKAFSAIVGMRYHNNRLLMNRSDDQGYYRPSFMDAQTAIHYKGSENWNFSFIGNITGNHYKYEPNRATVAFGGYNASNVTILYNGQEEDKYSSLFGAFVSTYKTQQTKIEAIFSAYHTQEKEYFDIEASYLVLDQQADDSDPLFGSEVGNPQPIRKGVASQYTHARNNYDGLAMSAEVKGVHKFDQENTALQWGVKYTHENSRDRLSEWELMDSLGYVLPQKSAFASLYSKHNVDIDRLMAYGEWNKTIFTQDAKISLNAGARMHWWKMSESDQAKIVVSPRVQVGIEPSNWREDMLFTLALGLYQQPPSYREYRGFDGQLNPDLKAQKAWVFVLGNQYRFTMWDKRFRMQSEIYYKNMDDVNRYTLDNVRVRYVANNDAKAYVYGADIRLYGEFILGTESWISIGYMKTEENGENKGYIARPTDQRLKFGLLFQDYMPSIPNLKLYLNAVYNTGLPGGSPSYVDPYLYQGRLRDYKRADIGFNYVFKDQTIGQNKKWLHGIDELQVGVEIYNVFNVANAITNTWIRDLNDNSEYAIPNYMTSRTFTMKIALTF